MLQKFIGDKQFYRQLLALSIPLMIQNGITAFVNMLDNIMVGAVGTEQMTGVAVANQLIFVFNLCIFGVMSGAGLFGAQFSGKSDHEGLRHTFRFKILAGILFTGLGIALFLFAGKPLCALYMTEGESGLDAAATLEYAYEYLLVILIGLLPYTLTQCYAGTLRETGRSVPSMVAGIVAVLVNLCLNYVLIFGKFGAPAMGIVGAAIATNISRVVELAVVAIWTHAHKKDVPFIKGAYRSLHIPKALVKQIIVRGLPLMLNETIWAAGMATLCQCYSLRGLDVMAANNISQTFLNVFSVSFKSVGVAIGIMLGQILGAGQHEKARRDCPKMLVFSVIVSIVTAGLFAALAGWIPSFYNTTDEVRSIATMLMLITAMTMPLDAFANATYFTLRAGGKTFVTFLFDSGFVWVIATPVAMILANLTTLPILPLYAIVQCLNLIKCLAGGYLVKQGSWVQNIVDQQ